MRPLSKLVVLIGLVVIASVALMWMRPSGNPVKPPGLESPSVSSPTAPAPIQPDAPSVPGAVPVPSTGSNAAQGSLPAQSPASPPKMPPLQPALAAANRAGAGAPPENSPESVVVQTDLENVQVMLREYRTAVGENPVGTNAEIMRAVMGDNIKQVKLTAPDGSSVNAKGELVDRWGTPYFFHQISATRTEIRSAGPDRVMWTGDDQQK